MSHASHYQFLTAAGPAAIALVRISGPAVPAFLQQHVRFANNRQPATLQLGDVERITLHAHDGELIDDAILSVHRETPAWDVRLHLHGGLGLRKRCETLLNEAGFVREADQTPAWQVECPFYQAALAHLPEILTETGVRWLLTQPAKLRALNPMRRPDIENVDRESPRQEHAAIAARADWISWFKTPLRIAIAGEPNAGKSTLVNALAQRSVSLVSATVGTTRDWVAASDEIDGFPVEWLDTAGLFEAADPLDAVGIEKTRQLLSLADVVALAVPLDEPAAAVQRGMALLDRQPNVIVRTCADRADGVEGLTPGGETPVVAISALTGRGLDAFRTTILGASTRRAFDPEVPVPLSDAWATYHQKFSQPIDDNDVIA